jgi:hypothetical protein
MRPPDDLKDWSKKDLMREVARLRAVLHEHSARRGDDPRAQSTESPIIGGSPTGRGDALLDARAAVLLDAVEVVLVDTKSGSDSVVMMLTLGGRVNYADDRVTHAYLFNGDGAAGIVSELIALAGRASGMHDDPNAERFAAEFKVALEERMADE